MKRMKTFLIYLLLVVAVVILTNPIANLILGLNYKEISNYEIATSSPEIIITESKGTNTNGIIKGTVTNKTEHFMPDIYLKIELKSDIGNTLGTEYKKMGNFQIGQSKDFDLKYRYSGVKGYVISTVDDEEPSNIKLHPALEHAETLYMVGRLVAYAITPGYLFLPLFLFRFAK